MITAYAPQSDAIHSANASAGKRRAFWQILFPVIAAGVLVIGLVVFLVFFRGEGGPSNEVLAGVATVMLILPLLLALLIKLIVLAAMIYGVTKLNSVIPGAGRTALGFMLKAQDAIRGYADKAVEPILSTQAKETSLRQVVRSFTSRFSVKG